MKEQMNQGVSRNVPIMDRFNRPYYEVDDNGCWNWLRGFIKGGYGVIWSPELQRNEGVDPEYQKQLEAVYGH